jgi:hypothetical protein
MNRKSILSYVIIFGILVLLAGGAAAWAEPPAINIDLVVDQDSFGSNEPIGVTVTVSNDTGQDLLISKGFSAKLYYLEMRVVDPAGRFLLARRDEVHDEFPDAPPVPFLLYQGKFIRTAACEVLQEGWSNTVRSENIRDYYEMGLPGYYSAQVQLSAMVFKGVPGDPCDINDYEWLGVLKSETQYFYVGGSTDVNILPKKWRIVWQNGRYIAPNVKVTIWPQEGKTIDDYQQEGIKLNNVAAKQVFKLYSFLKKKYYLLALFNKKEAINSLGDVELRQWYPVVISGRLESGQPFGGSQQIRIVR